MVEALTHRDGEPEFRRDWGQIGEPQSDRPEPPELSVPTEIFALDRTPTQTVDTVEELPRGVLLPIGSRVAGRYEIRGVLGSGGFSIVYLAHDRELDRQVALKVLRPDQLSEKALIRLRREAGVARDAANPHLVRIFDIGHDRELVYLSMEVVTGQTLRDRLVSGPVPVSEALDIARQLLRGLAALHELSIVHRDVKPANVILSPEGVKLVDLGLARPLDNNGPRATETHAIVGTRQYLSPEQARGEHARASSDLFSLGIVLFEMLTGTKPLSQATSPAPARDAGGLQKPDLRKLPPESPCCLHGLIARLLAVEPPQRFRSAAEALDHLERCSARSASKLGTRFRLGALLLVSLLLVGTVAWWHSSRPRFDRLLRDPPVGTRGLDQCGRTLWTIPSHTHVEEMAIEAGAPSVLATIARRTTGPADLALLDRTSLALLKKVTLPEPYEGAFPGYSSIFKPKLHVVDLDSDGADELLITFVHDYWPSYTVLYDPRTDRSRIVFIASGHHRVQSAVDLDGDGIKELLIGGINNMMGWYTGLAAVRALLRTGEEGRDWRSILAVTPDHQKLATRNNGLLWYALLPRGFFRGHFSTQLEVDSKNRVIAARHTDGHSYRVDFDGLPIDVETVEATDVRQQVRDLAYRELREATRLMAFSAQDSSAVSHARQARRLAEQAADPVLTEWSQRVEGVALASSGQTEAADSLFDEIAAMSEAAADISFDAGHALYLASEQRLAAKWFRHGLGPAGSPEFGRLRYEFLFGLILTLTETGRYEEALDATYRFDADGHQIRGAGAPYRSYVRWRRGEVGELLWNLPPDEAQDHLRYWWLEFKLSDDNASEELLRLVQEELAEASETTPMVESLRAEVLRRLDRPDEAFRAARRAVELAEPQLPSSMEVCGHFDIILERLEAAALAAGDRAEAERAAKRLTEWRRQRSGD